MLRDTLRRFAVVRTIQAWTAALVAGLVLATCAPPPAYAEVRKPTCEGIGGVASNLARPAANDESILVAYESVAPEQRYILQRVLGAAAVHGWAAEPLTLRRAAEQLCVITFGRYGKLT